MDNNLQNSDPTIYHVYNRGTDKRTIFQDNFDYERFKQSLIEFNSKTPIQSIYANQYHKHILSTPSTKNQYVQILAYCLNPNHFHLLIKPNAKESLSNFMQKIGGGYTRYFNEKYQRTGVLFQGKYKSKEIIDNEYLLHVSAYVMLNNQIHNYDKDTLAKTKSSWNSFINDQTDDICSGYEIIKDQFKNISDLIKYFNESAKNSKARKEDDREFANILIESDT